MDAGKMRRLAPLMGAAYEALAVVQKLQSGGTPTLVGESVRQKS